MIRVQKNFTIIFNDFCRWDHAENFFVRNYDKKNLNDTRELIININVAYEEFKYLKGHIINEKNLFPATGYLFHMWEMIASLKGQKYTDTTIVFEEVNFIRATVLSEENEVELTLSIQEGNTIT